MNHDPAIEATIPVVVDLGKQSKKRIKKLKRGEGKLMDEIMEVLQQVKGQLGEDLEGKVLVPLVIIYERKQDTDRITSLFEL